MRKLFTYKSLSIQIVLDQSSFMGVHVLWESQLEYHVCHNDWEEVSRLLDLIPPHILVVGSLQVNLDGLQAASTFECNRGSDYDYLCSLEELDSVCMDVPEIKVFRFSYNVMCSIWLRMLMEEKLARKLIFSKEYWEGTADILPLLARSGFITSKYKMPSEDDNIEDTSVLKLSDGGTVQALHKLLIHHCAQYNLPYLLDLYLDQHELVSDSDSVHSLQEAAVSFLISSDLLLLLLVLFHRSHLSTLLAVYICYAFRFPWFGCICPFEYVHFELFSFVIVLKHFNWTFNMIRLKIWRDLTHVQL